MSVNNNYVSSPKKLQKMTTLENVIPAGLKRESRYETNAGCPIKDFGHDR